ASLTGPAPVFLLSFLLLRRPPAPTLFPYTTLFRSQLVQQCGNVSRLNREIFLDLLRGHRLDPQRLVPNEGRYPGRGHDDGFFGRDRKSTRLNSSHLVISYAVFCLKKKTTSRLARRR